jgi:hypothetical protein
MANLLLTNYPSYTIDDVGLATAVRADYASNVFIKVDHGFISKALKTLDLKTF